MDFFSFFLLFFFFRQVQEEKGDTFCLIFEAAGAKRNQKFRLSEVSFIYMILLNVLTVFICKDMITVLKNFYIGNIFWVHGTDYLHFITFLWENEFRNMNFGLKNSPLERIKLVCRGTAVS